MKFVLEIELGNAAMNSLVDISRALKEVKDEVKIMALMEEGINAVQSIGDCPIFDINGNEVGFYKVVK